MIRSVLLSVVVLFVIVPLAHASNYVVSPEDLVIGGGFSYDHDQPKPDGATIGNGNFGSFFSNVDGIYGPPHSSGVEGSKRYTSFRFTPAAIGFSGMTLNDIQSITYDSKKDGGTRDWQMKVYTVGDATNWYGHRVNFETDSSNHDWQTYTITGTSVTDSDRAKAGPDLYDRTFDTIKADYGNESILFFDISAGYNSDLTTSQSYLDNVTVTHATLGTADINLVPEPASVGLLGMGAIGLLLRRHRKRVA